MELLVEELEVVVVLEFDVVDDVVDVDDVVELLCSDSLSSSATLSS